MTNQSAIVVIELTSEEKEALHTLAQEIGLADGQELIREIAIAQLDRRARGSNGEGHWWTLNIEG